ncbi:MAG: hypothetical protein RBG13Loki_0527 [Promethearchaeota archaeon CR_4]|nr:MAG: hypothetical protein RBG13Loki_0527 [Candidatus Lokiarchaeota archaeon CR_4]
MKETFVEIVGDLVVIFHPETGEEVVELESLDEALTYARSEWPDLGIRIDKSVGIQEMVSGRIFPGVFC